MDIYNIRKRNLRRIINDSFGGVAANLSRALDVQPNVISRIFTRNEKHRRNVGNEMAREIERVVHLQPGWLDREHWPPARAHDDELPKELLEIVKILKQLPPSEIKEIKQYLRTRLLVYNQRKRA